jgi:hypothetical protein
MANTLKKLKELAGTASTEEVQVVEDSEVQKKVKKARKEQSIDTVLIGAHFPRAVRRSLSQLQADPRNDRKKINDLLAEALNDLFAKYNVPQTATLGKSD